MKLTRQQKILLAKMIKDNRISPEIFQPGPGNGWSKLVKEFEKRFRFEGIRDVENQHFNSRFSAFPPGNRAYYRFACYQLLSKISDRGGDDYIQVLRKNQSQAPLRANEIDISGLRASWDLLISLDEFVTINKESDIANSNQPVIVELGAGWGRLAEVWMRIRPDSTYVILDLPHSLLISHEYLPKKLSQVSHHPYSSSPFEPITRDRLKASQGVHYFGSQELINFEDKSIDMFINIASFQEMTNKQVEGYFQLIDNKVRGFLFNKQINHSNFKDGFIFQHASYPYLHNWNLRFSGLISYDSTYREEILDIN